MIFNSVEFAIFLPIVFTIYWLLNRVQLRWQNLFLLSASYFFYGWWDWRFLFLLFFSSSVDFLTAFYMDRTDNSSQRKWLLALTLISNLGILGFFKYYNFFVDSFVTSFSLFHVALKPQTLRIILPIGISFYTFQSIAYVIDVYKRQLKAYGDYITFIAFVSFFPQLVAGPISRAQNLLTRFYQPRKFDAGFAVTGLRFILFGLFKKVVIADNLAKLVDEVYNSPSAYPGIASAVATIFFALQIYCDFSGYSDIAIGTARLFGFDLVQNFRTPYFSASIKEFWQRWHISLSTWFRDYLYIPLGGNRAGGARRYFNLFITFLISGLWHGANWTFIIWGGIHGSVCMLENFLTPKTKIKLPRFLKQVITFTVVCFAWIFFRAKSLPDASMIILGLSHSWNFDTLIALITKVYISWTFFIALIVTVISFLFIESQWINNHTFTWSAYPRPVRWSIYYFAILLIVFLGLNDHAPNFIYFKF